MRIPRKKKKALKKLMLARLSIREQFLRLGMDLIIDPPLKNIDRMLQEYPLTKDETFTWNLLDMRNKDEQT